jgi:signal transduction histidine kinase
MGITDRRLAQHALSTAPAILPLLSHELRTPLAVIKGFAALLVRYHDRLPPEEQREMLDEIGLACERLEGAIAHVVQIGEMAAGQIDCSPVVLDLAQALRDVLDRAPGNPAYAASFPTLLCPGPCWMYGDPRQVDHLLSELVELAQTLSAAGDPMLVTLRSWPDTTLTSPPSTQKTWWEVEIQFVGSALVSLRLATLFQPFSADAHLLVDDASQIAPTVAHCRLLAVLLGGLFWIDGHDDQESALHLVLPAVS